MLRELRIVKADLDRIKLWLEQEAKYRQDTSSHIEDVVSVEAILSFCNEARRALEPLLKELEFQDRISRAHFDNEP